MTELLHPPVPAITDVEAVLVSRSRAGPPSVQNPKSAGGVLCPSRTTRKSLSAFAATTGSSSPLVRSALRQRVVDFDNARSTLTISVSIPCDPTTSSLPSGVHWALLT